MAGCASAPSDRKTPPPEPVSAMPAAAVTPTTIPAAAATTPAATVAQAPTARHVSKPRAPLPAPADVSATDVVDPLSAGALDGTPAPIGAAALADAGTQTVAGLTPEQYPDVFDRIRAGFKLDDVESPRIDQQLAFYANNPEYLERVFGRAGLYLHHIVQEIESRGMPLELALLPV